MKAHWIGFMKNMSNSKKVIEAIETIVNYCDKMDSCQNCIFRKHEAYHWECLIHVWDIKADFDKEEILARIEAKSHNHGYL